MPEFGNAQRVEIRRHDGYSISTDPDRLQLDLIHRYLTQSYWAKGIPRDRVQRSIRHSLIFGAT